MQITAKSLLSTAAGGELHITENGEVLGSLFLPAGEVLAGPYLDRLPPGASFALGAGVAVLPPRSYHGVQKYGEGSHDSGANPDFQPTSASRMEREMRLALNKLQATQTTLEARMRAFGNIERVPDAGAPAPAPAPDPASSPADEAVIE